MIQSNTGTLSGVKAPMPPLRRSLKFLRCPLKRFIRRSEEHTSELQSLMRISYAVFCLKKKKKAQHIITTHHRRYQNHKHRRTNTSDHNKTHMTSPTLTR